MAEEVPVRHRAATSSATRAEYHNLNWLASGILGESGLSFDGVPALQPFISSFECLRVPALLFWGLRHDGGHFDRQAPIVDSNERKIGGVCGFSEARQLILSSDVDSDLHGRCKCAVHRRLERHDLSDPDRLMENQFIHRSGHANPIAMPLCADSGRNI